MVPGKQYDWFKIDVCSCGNILYDIFCGYLPFENPDNEVLFKKISEYNSEFPIYIKKASKDLIKKILVTGQEKRISIPENKKHPFYLKEKNYITRIYYYPNLILNYLFWYLLYNYLYLHLNYY